MSCSSVTSWSCCHPGLPLLESAQYFLGRMFYNLHFHSFDVMCLRTPHVYNLVYLLCRKINTVLICSCWGLVYCNTSSPSGGRLNLAFNHDVTNWIAAESSDPIARLLGSRRSPSSLNIRSQSQLEAGIIMISIANCAKLVYFCRSFIQYLTGLPSSRYCSFVYLGSYFFQRSNSSMSLTSALPPSTKALITLSILLRAIIFRRARGTCSGLYSA